MTDQTLKIKVGAGIKPALALARQAMEQLSSERRTPVPYGASFKSVSQMLSVFTEKRWDLPAALRENGAMSIAE